MSVNGHSHEEHTTLDGHSYCEWMWSDRDAGSELQLHDDKCTVTFHPNISTVCTAIRGAKALSPNMEHYFEVEMRPPFHGQARQVGLGTSHTTLQSNTHDYYPLLGKDINSWGINYNGYKQHSGKMERHILFDANWCDVIRVGVLYDAYYGALSFELNGKSSGLAFNRIVTNLDLYPMLCSSSANSVMKLTHSSSCVMSLKALCRGVIRMNVSKEEDYDRLALPNHIKAYLTYRTHKSGRNTHKNGACISRTSII